MNQVKKAFFYIIDLLGFKKNDKYVTKYLNDANIKSSIYMSFIIVAIEIWMIIRQIVSYVAPEKYWANPEYDGFFGKIDLLFKNTSLYLLFIMGSVAVFVFAITYLRSEKMKKSTAIVNYVIGGLCISWIFLLFAETVNFDNTIMRFDSICLIALYSTLPLLGISIIVHTFYRMQKGENSTPLSILVIICFALLCLVFGFKVGYSDFASLDKKIGDAWTAENIIKRFDRIKMITCFLTMVLFVGCILIWKPYISVIMLATIFFGFALMLKKSGLNREFLEGDEINYYTFLISLSVISISIYRQRLAEAKKEQKLEHDSIFDNLVDIHNYKYLARTVNNMQKVNDPSLNDKMYLFINIVNFRTINDHKGFDAGNKFLKDFASNVEDAFQGDIVSRQADDHFVVLTSTIGYMDRINILSSLLDELADGLFVQLKVGGYIPKINEDPTRSMDKARYACGTIKKKYGVIYCEYDLKMDEGFRKRQYIINHLDEAIRNDWIQAYYQPVVWSESKEMCGVEALARWIDPNYGFLSPADFIPILEDTRLIHKLDSHIINFVCRHMRNALDRGRTIVPVSINFSRLDFELMDAPQLLRDTLEKYEIDKEYVHVEITESALSDEEGKLNKSIDQLKKEGYAIWLDDFGSGYSSLNVLKDYEFDVVKIDMKFLSNFDKNEKSKDVIDCIIRLSNRLGMRTLTEGVETEEQAKFLESIGCDRLQGYLFGKPFKLEDFEAKIDNGELVISDKLLINKER